MTNAQKVQELNNKLSHPDVYPISESEREAIQKELKRIQNLPDNWEYAAEGESASEQVLKKYEGQTSKDIAEQRITPKQQGVIPKGNQGDNAINNPDALDTSEVTDMHQKELASVQTPENMNPATFTADSSIREGNKVAAAAGIDATPDKDDTPAETEAKKRYNRSMMSIWDAVREGEIDKDTAAYFTIDAIATLAKNLGRGIGNVGAQFTGGTIDQGHDTSKWEERRNRLFGEETEMEAEGMGGPSGRKAEMENLDIAAKRIRNEYTPAQLETQLGLLQKELEMAGINVNLASSKTDIINYIKSDPNYSNDPIKMGIVAYLSQAGTAGAANAAGNTLANAANWILTLAK